MAKRKTSVIKSYDSIDELMSDINSNYTGVIDDEPEKRVEFETTNLSGLDHVLGGGRPKGRIIEIFGKESSGKTGMALHLIGICQRLKGKAVLIDAEYAYDVNYAKALKVKTDELKVIHPDCGEDALNITEKLVRSGLVDIIVIDSVSALVPKAEVEGEMGASHMGLQARMMSQALRKLVGIVSKSNCTVIFINQIRVKIGIMFGNPNTTSGGQALKFYASIRLEVKRIKWIGDDDNPMGIKQNIRAVKNKVAAPFRSVELDMYFNSGYSVAKDLFNHCVNFDILSRKGPAYTYKGKKFIGMKSVLEAIRVDSSFRKSLKKEVKECFENIKVGESD